MWLCDEKSAVKQEPREIPPLSKEYCLHPPGFKPRCTHTANGSRQPLAKVLDVHLERHIGLRTFNDTTFYPYSLVPLFFLSFITHCSFIKRLHNTLICL